MRQHELARYMARNLLFLLPLIPYAVTAQISSRSAAIQQRGPAQATTESTVNTGVAAVRENYTKFEHRIPMRDSVKLFTSVYIPKEVFTDGKTFPIMLQRTPYSVSPYGVDQYRASLGPQVIHRNKKDIGFGRACAPYRGAHNGHDTCSQDAVQ